MRVIVVGLLDPYTMLHGKRDDMRFEVVEDADEWIVRSEGCELGRFADQEKALHAVADRLREADTSEPARLSVRYQARNT